MQIEFKKYNRDPNDFFRILPHDWQETLLPIWTKNGKDADVFVLCEAEQIIAGGIVFRGFTDEMNSFKTAALSFINSECYYIGYLWVIESRRGEDLGSLWLKSVKEYDPKANYWLTIEEEKLKNFYIKNGFKLLKESKNKGNKEWLFLFETAINCGK
tara:strand:- start:5013 stop:5483 length:471 start_codon:yes stop_codon:yes gene_type:complete